MRWIEATIKIDPERGVATLNGQLEMKLMELPEWWLKRESKATRAAIDAEILGVALKRV